MVSQKAKLAAGDLKKWKPQPLDFHNGANTAPKLPFNCQAKRQKIAKHFDLKSDALKKNSIYISNDNEKIKLSSQWK